MTKDLKLNTQYLLLIFVFLAFSFLFLALSRLAFAQTPEEIAAKYDVTFPVAELGECEDYTSCHTYCEDPVHQEACIDFAKEKGFYKEEEFRPSESMLKRAQTILGCNSFESCREFCSREANFDRCHSFAQSVGVVGGYKEDPTSREFLAKARESLGCDSYQSCRNFCDNPANRDKCAEFARKIGVNGGYEYKGPGGCTSEQTCRTFCSAPGNVDICRQFVSSYGGKFSGPGGCSDEASCRAYCEKNPSACPGFGQSSGSPAEYCSRTPGCSWSGSTCQCSGGSYSVDPAAECQKYNCSWAGSYCQCSSTGDYQEKWKSECTNYPGCSWTGTSCQCTSGGGQYSPPPNYTPYPARGTYDPATECAKQSGCSWTGSSCQCSGSTGSTPYPTSSSTYDPATECSKYPGCSWTGTTCQCSSGESSPQPVYGSSTSSGGLLQRLIEYLLGQ